MAVLADTVFNLCAFAEILILCAGQYRHMQNIALNKVCQISSRYIIAPGRITGDCSAAINGDTNTILDLARSRSNCINTKLDDTSPFWSVDLGQEFSINTISIYGRANYTNRMICVNVSLDGNVVKRFSDTNGWTNDKYEITVSRSGRVINITKDCVADVYSLNLCQVQVWVCEDGWYGDCTQTCGHCAGGSVCDKMNGSCTSCQTGFQLPMCTDCKDGWYGKSCLETCGHCVGGNSTCDKTSGSCSACDGSFQPPWCQELMPSYDEKMTVSLVGPVAGAAVGCSVLFFITGAVFAWWFRKTRSRHPAGAVRSPDNISMFFNLGSSIGAPYSDNNQDITYSEIPLDPSGNVYDALHAGADDNTAAYTSLTFHIDSKEIATATDYISERNNTNVKNSYKINQGKFVCQ